MNIRDRLMSRASVAAMAAHAKAPEGGDTSKVGQAENVDDTAVAGSDADLDDLGSLSVEEQAQVDAMKAGRDPAAAGDIEPEGAAGETEEGDGEGDEADGAGDTGADAAAAETEGGDRAADTDAGPEPTRIGYGKHKRLLAKEAARAADLQKQLEAARGETAKEREARVRLDERTKQLLEAIQTKPAAQSAPKQEEPDTDPEPDGEADPIGHGQWKIRKLEKDIADLRSGRQQDQQTTAAEREAIETYNAYEHDVTAAAQVDPNFGDAFAHVRESRYRELGYFFANIDITNEKEVQDNLTLEQQGKLKQAIQQTFHNEQMEIARAERKAGRPIAARVKQLAIARGWAPKAAPAGGEQQQQNGGAAPPAKKPGNGAAAPSVTDQLASIREGTQNSRSLSDGGGSPGGAMTPERLASMPDDEFEEFMSQNSKSKLDRIMGKPATT